MRTESILWVVVVGHLLFGMDRGSWVQGQWENVLYSLGSKTVSIELKEYEEFTHVAMLT